MFRFGNMQAYGHLHKRRRSLIIRDMKTLLPCLALLVLTGCGAANSLQPFPSNAQRRQLTVPHEPVLQAANEDTLIENGSVIHSTQDGLYYWYYHAYKGQYPSVPRKHLRLLGLGRHIQPRCLNRKVPVISMPTPQPAPSSWRITAISICSIAAAK